MLKLDAAQKKNFDMAKVRRPLGKNRILAPYLDAALENFDDEWEFKYRPKEQDDAWHPSGDCVPPASALYAKALAFRPEEKRRLSAALTKIFTVGHFWHQLLQYIVVREGLADIDAIEQVGMKRWDLDEKIGLELINPEGIPLVIPAELVKPKPFHWIKGQGDIAPLITPNWTGLVDIKTMSENHFKLATLPESFALKYICQMNIYMELFDLDQSMILAVNKNGSHDFKEITFVRNQLLIDAIFAKWDFVSACLQKGIPPTPADDDKFALPTVAELNNS